MIRRLLLLALVATAPQDAPAAQPYDTVLASPHNFFVRSEFPIGSRVCYGCHAEGPGRAAASSTAAVSPAAPPDGSASSAPAVQPDAQPAPPPPLWQRGAKGYAVSLATGGSSTACLGCHDGVLAQEVHRMGEPDHPVFDHPYNVVYPRRANGRFVPERPTVNQYRYWSIADLHNGDLVLPTGPTSTMVTTDGPGAVRTSEGRVQCDSCHDPHNNGSAPFLRAPAQDLCLVCHDR